MTPFEIYIYTRLHVLRRVVQFLALAFIFVIPILNMLGFRQIIGTFYSISIGNLDIIDPALMLQTIFLTKEIHFPLLLAGIIPLILTLIFGKVFCGWVCPFNLIAEYTDKLRRKIRPGSVKISNSNPKVHYYWLVFGTFVMLMTVSGIPIITLISMPGLISAQAADLVFFSTIGIELSVVLIILVIEVFYKERFWCKFACPVGATLAFLRAKHTLSIHYDAKICSEQCPVDKFKLSLCNSACPLNLNPRLINEKQNNIYPYCFNCGECVDACQNKGSKAIFFTFHPEKMKKTSHVKFKLKNTDQPRRKIYEAK